MGEKFSHCSSTRIPSPNRSPSASKVPVSHASFNDYDDDGDDGDDHDTSFNAGESGRVVYLFQLL